MTIPTPDLSHLTKADYEHVYEPAEDTFILLDALEQDAEELRRIKPRVCLEIGSGSGCVSSFIGRILGPSSTLYLTTDINPHASRSTLATGRQNQIPIEALIAPLAGPISARLNHAVDILLFNPPYVPTDADEADTAQTGADVAGAWAGGADGMQITNIVLSQVKDLLSPTGRFYLVAVKQNDVSGICQRMKKDYSLDGQVVLQRRAGGEHLYVIRFAWHKETCAHCTEHSERGCSGDSNLLW